MHHIRSQTATLEKATSSVAIRVEHGPERSGCFT